MLAFFFLWGAWMKLGMPLEEAVKIAPWVAAHPGLARFTGVVDLMGGLGIVLPALLRIRPRLSVLAAVGIIVLQLLAMGFHLMRGEAMVLPMNVVLLVLAPSSSGGAPAPCPSRPVAEPVTSIRSSASRTGTCRPRTPGGPPPPA